MGMASKSAQRGADVIRLPFVRYLSVFLVGLAGLATAADPRTEQLLKQVERRYNSAITLTVHFSETYRGPGRPARTETGTLYLLKPGKMRWEYTSPARWERYPYANACSRSPLAASAICQPTGQQWQCV